MLILLAILSGVVFLSRYRFYRRDGVLAFFSPDILTCVPFTLALLLYSGRYSSLLSKPSTELYEVSALYLFSTLGACYFWRLILPWPQRISNKYIFQKKWNTSSVPVKRILSLALIFTLFNFIEFAISGSVPAFSNDPEKARFVAGGNGFLHVFSVSLSYLLPALSVYYGGHLSKTEKRLLIFVSVVSIGVTSLWLSRGLLFISFVMAIFIFSLRSAPIYIRQLKTFMVASLIVALLAGIKVLRGYAEYGDDYLISQASVVDSAIPPWAGVLYLTVTYNFEVLNQYILGSEYLPQMHGLVTLSPFAKLLQFEQITELSFQNSVLGFSRDTVLTSTVAGTAFLDFREFGVVAMGFLIGTIYSVAYARLKGRTKMSKYLYSFLVAQAFFIPYTNPIFQIHTLVAVFVGVCVFGSIDKAKV